MHNDVILAIDNGQLTVKLFLDLSSAFDTVNHDIMLSILHRRFSVEGAALNWFHSYLTDRSQTFSVGDSNSDPHSVSCTVRFVSPIGMFLLIYSDFKRANSEKLTSKVFVNAPRSPPKKIAFYCMTRDYRRLAVYLS